MVFASRFIRATRAPKQGEIALTLTVLSLITMLIGTVIGLNRPQDVRTKAAGPVKVQCGQFGCSNNSDCSQTPIQTLCHLSTGQCRPMLSTDSCPSVTARAESTKKDVGGSCITKTDCKTGLDCSPGRTCTVPAGGSGGGAGTDGGATGAPSIPQPTLQDRTRYRTYPGQCEMLFSNIDDPRIMRLTLSTTSGTVLFDTDKEQNGCMPFNSPSKGDSISINYDPRSQQNVIVRATSSGGLGGADKTCTFGRQGLSNGAEADPLIVTMYYQVQQGLQGQRVWNSYSQSANTTGGCVERRNTPTPTATPTQPEKLTQKRNCWQSCTSDAQCNKTPEGNVLKCRYPQFIKQGDTNKYCLLPNEDTLDCKPKATTATPTIPTKTPTPTATRTPTPTIPTPSVTQPPRCYKSVYFMIDTSSTQQSNIKPLIEKPLNDYFSTKTFKNVTFTYNTFNIAAPRQSGGPSNETIQFSLADNQNWTNLNAAFDVIRSRKEDIRVLISDGIPSVLGPFTNVRAKNSSVQLQCAYDTDGKNAKGCSPVADTPGRDDNYMKENDCKKDNMFGANFNEYCKVPYPVGTSTATHAVRLGGNEGISTANLRASGAGVIYKDMDEFLGALEGIIKNAPCHPEPLTLRPVTSSFSIQNTSLTKTISSVDVKTCSSTGKQCQTFTNPVRIEPQSTKQFSQSIPETVLPENRTVFTCNLKLTDGSSLPCPEKKAIDESVRFSLQSNGKQVSGSAQTFLQAADVNKDGRVNAIDYVLCQKQIVSKGAKSCDIIPDNVVNAQDFSVVTERFGQSTQINQ